MREFILREKYKQGSILEVLMNKKIIVIEGYLAFNRWCQNLAPFDIGGTTIVIDTTDFSIIDYNKYMEDVRIFLNT